jgi:hypothetical protein
VGDVLYELELYDGANQNILSHSESITGKPADRLSHPAAQLGPFTEQIEDLFRADALQDKARCDQDIDCFRRVCYTARDDSRDSQLYGMQSSPYGPYAIATSQTIHSRPELFNDLAKISPRTTDNNR